MTALSIWPYFICMFAVMLLACSPLMQSVDGPPTAAPRLASIDGIRGILALGVFFHHAVIYHAFNQTGEFHLTPSPFYNVLGQGSVSLFFMITGYLFWSKVIADQGRTDWGKLLVGRVFRIAPVYLLVVCILVVIAFARTNFELQTTPSALVRALVRWMALGAVAGYDINGYWGTKLIVAGVTWTLHYEWLFYASLPFTAYFACRLGSAKLFASLLASANVSAVAAFMVFSEVPPEAVFSLLFSIGMATAGRTEWVGRVPDVVRSAAVIGLIAAVMNIPTTVYALVPSLLLGAIFHLVASGCTVFGLLTCRPARRLGEISFDIYMVHGIILSLIFAHPYLKSMAMQSGMSYWLAILVISVLVVMMATLMHVFVERPGIRLGRRIVARASNRLGSGSSNNVTGSTGNQMVVRAADAS